jgi:NTP pyrophosphatase (non-canonical NTP hydrolase)
MDLTEIVLSAIRAERERQENKWGLQRHDNGKWLAILGEEFGEVAQAMQKDWGWGKPTDAQNLFEELIHVSAVSAAWAEQVLEYSDKKPPYMDLDDE